MQCAVLNGYKELGNTAAVTGSQLPLTVHMTSDMTSYMICDITSDMTCKMTYEMTPDILYDIQHDICWVFWGVFNDIKSNTTSDKLSVLISNTTNCVTFSHLNVI